MFINFPWQTVSLLDFEAIFHDCPTMFDLFIKLYQQICWLESIPFTAGCRISRFSYVPSCWLYSHLQSIKYISYYMHKLIYIYVCVTAYHDPIAQKGTFTHQRKNHHLRFPQIPDGACRWSALVKVRCRPLMYTWYSGRMIGDHWWGFGQFRCITIDMSHN